MTSTDSAKRVSPETLTLLEQELAENGYSVIRGVVSKEPLSEFNARLAKAYDRSREVRGRRHDRRPSQLLPRRGGPLHLRGARRLWDCGSRSAMRHGKRCNLRAQVNYNLPGSSPQHYHMDSLFADEFLLCNVAIVDTDEINGAIDVLPTTNREFYPYWRFALERKSQLSTRVVLEQGDLMVRTSNLWHRGMPNKTATVRPMMALLFGKRVPRRATHSRPTVRTSSSIRIGTATKSA